MAVFVDYSQYPEKAATLFLFFMSTKTRNGLISPGAAGRMNVVRVTGETGARVLRRNGT
jgi:hypothetical protein